VAQLARQAVWVDVAEDSPVLGNLLGLMSTTEPRAADANGVEADDSQMLPSTTPPTPTSSSWTMDEARLIVPASRGDDQPASASLSAVYRDFSITAAATHRLAGLMMVHTTLTGGRRGIAHKFTVPSEAADPVSACEEALADLRRVIDQLLA